MFGQHPKNFYSLFLKWVPGRVKVAQNFSFWCFRFGVARVWSFLGRKGRFLSKVYDAITQNWKASHVSDWHTHCLSTWKKFWEKFFFFRDNFYLVKLMQPLEIFAPSKVTLPPTLNQPQIDDQTPFAIMKKISKIWMKVFPRSRINTNKPFLTQAG